MTMTINNLIFIDGAWASIAATWIFRVFLNPVHNSGDGSQRIWSACTDLHRQHCSLPAASLLQSTAAPPPSLAVLTLIMISFLSPNHFKTSLCFYCLLAHILCLPLRYIHWTTISIFFDFFLFLIYFARLFLLINFSERLCEK